MNHHRQDEFHHEGEFLNGNSVGGYGAQSSSYARSSSSSTGQYTFQQRSTALPSDVPFKSAQQPAFTSSSGGGGGRDGEELVTVKFTGDEVVMFGGNRRGPYPESIVAVFQGRNSGSSGGSGSGSSESKIGTETSRGLPPPPLRFLAGPSSMPPPSSSVPSASRGGYAHEGPLQETFV